MQVDTKLSLLPNLIKSQFPPVFIENPPVFVRILEATQYKGNCHIDQWIAV